ncbi:hypothetical protein D3C87_1934480 [compost metagenome]
MLAWKVATISAGTALPIKICQVVNGDTSSCSSVPCSRSRATDSEVTISTPMVVIMAISDGTTNHL